MSESLVLPHPRDVLADPSYRPGDHLLPRNDGSKRTVRRNLAEIPGHPHALLRWFPNDGETVSYVDEEKYHRSTKEVTREDLEAIMATQQRHVALAQSVGLRVVDHVADILPIQTEFWDGLAWVAVVRKVIGRQLTESDPAGFNEPYKLECYVRKCRDNREEYVLDDWFNPAQMMVEAVDDREVATIVDIDPYRGVLMQLEYPTETMQLWDSAIDDYMAENGE